MTYSESRTRHLLLTIAHLLNLDRLWQILVKAAVIQASSLHLVHLSKGTQSIMATPQVRSNRAPMVKNRVSNYHTQ